MSRTGWGLLLLVFAIAVAALVVGCIGLTQVQDNAVYFRKDGVPTLVNTTAPLVVPGTLSLVNGSTDTAGTFNLAISPGPSSTFSFDVVFSKPLSSLPKVVMLSRKNAPALSNVSPFYTISASVVDKTKFTVNGLGDVTPIQSWSYLVVGEQ